MFLLRFAITILLFHVLVILGAVPPRISSPPPNPAFAADPKCMVKPSWTEPQLDRSDCLTILLHWENYVLNRYGEQLLEFLARGARGRSQATKEHTPRKYAYGESSITNAFFVLKF